MQSLHIHDKTFVPYLSAEDIQSSIKKLAVKLDDEYKNKTPLLISILNGSFMFAADLFKYLSIPAEICFIKLASYKGTSSTGHIVTSIGLDTEIANRDVIILEDIVDTGKTMNHLIPQLNNQHPASLKIAALLYKPDAKKYEIQVDYYCFSIPNKFVVGYGLDYDGLGRNIPSIYQLKEE